MHGRGAVVTKRTGVDEGYSLADVDPRAFRGYTKELNEKYRALWLAVREHPEVNLILDRAREILAERKKK